MSAATNPAAVLDPLVNALGQLNLQGTQNPGSFEGAKPPVEAASASKPAEQNNNDEELDDAEEEMSYTPYRPAKLKFGRDHPDPVVENSTLAAVAPPDVTYSLAMPAAVIAEGKLSNLQLEAVVYGCQRHEVDLPAVPTTAVVTTGADGVDVVTETKAIPARSGFLLGEFD